MFIFSRTDIEEPSSNFFILIICCWCSAKDSEKVKKKTILYFKQKTKGKVTFQSFTVVNILEESCSLCLGHYTRGKLFTVVNILEESCLPWSIYKRKAVYCVVVGKICWEKLFTVCQSVKYTEESYSLQSIYQNKVVQHFVVNKYTIKNLLCTFLITRIIS